MSGGESKTHSVRANRCEITLRGLRLCEANGIVVPWLRLGMHVQHGACAVWAYDEHGDRIRVGKRVVRWSAPLGQRRAVEGMVRRARRLALASGQFDIVERYTGNRRVERAGLAIFIVLVGSLVVSLGWSLGMGALSTLSGLPLSLQIASIAVVALFMGMTGVLLGVVMYMLLHVARCNVARLRVDGRGLEATLDDGSIHEAAWEDVASIRRVITGYVITLRSGMVLRTAFRRIGFVLDDRMQRVAGTAPESKALKRQLIRCFILFQIGGVLAAWLFWNGWGQAAHSPVTGYLLIGWLLPAGMSLQLAAPRLMGWLARRAGMKSRVRERQRRAGRVA